LEEWGKNIMSVSTKTSIDKSECQLSLWPYATISFILLIVLSSAILFPDYLNYKYKLRNLELSTQQYNSTLIALTLATQQYQSAPLSFRTALQNQASSHQPCGVDNLPSNDVPLKTSDIFETYGRLLTLFLGFASVLGVLLCYFLRKSLREIEEDIRQNVKHEMSLWKEGNDILSTSVKAQLKESKEHLDEFKKLTDENKKLLDILKVAADAETKTKKTSTTVEDATTALNNDPVLNNGH
jgi:gas vesicle protein